MQGTYWLTVLPETSQLRPRIKRAVRGLSDEVRVTPTVDERGAEPTGRSFGEKFRKGFERSGASRLGAGVRLIGASFGFAAGQASNVVRHVGAAATAIGVASRLSKGFAVSLLAASTGLKVVAGVSLARVAAGLGFAARQAGRLAEQVTRVTSAILVLSAVGKLLSFMNRAAKAMAIATVGTAALIGVVSALATSLGGPLVAALTAAGAAAGVFAGAAVGLLGPAIGVLKIGFKGLADGADAFAESMKDAWGPADEAFNTMIGKRMGPLLTQFRELRMAVVDTFSGALTPAFGSATSLMSGLQGRAVGLAKTLGGVGSQIAGALASPESVGALDKMFAASDRFVGSLGPGLSGLVTGLVQFASTAADTFASSGQSIGGMLQRFGDWLRGISPAQMVASFVAVRTVVTSVWSVLKPILTGIRDIGAVAAPALAPGIQAIGDAIGQAGPGLVKMTEILMPALSQVMERLAPIIPALVSAFTPWAGVLADVAPPLASIVANLAPAAPIIFAAVGAAKAATAAIALYKTGLLIAANATKVARTAWMIFNRAFVASPIGLIVTALVGLGIALWALFTKTETGRNLWDKIWTGIKTTVSRVWEWLKTTLTNAWTQIGPSVMRIGEVAKDAFGTFVRAVKTVWDAIQPAIKWIGNLWLSVQKVNFSVAIGALKALGGAIGWLWTNVVVPAFGGIASAAETMWSAAKGVWEAFSTAVQWVGDKVSWWWQNVTVPAFSAVKDAATDFWSGVKVIWTLFTAAIGVVGDKFGAFKDGVVSAFNTVRDVVTGVWDKIKGVIDSIGGGIGSVVDKLRSIPGLGALIPGAADGSPPGFAAGRPTSLSRAGVLRGPGTGTSDSILAMLSNGEGVVKESAMARGGTNVVAALNSGWVPSTEFLRGMLPGFAEGLSPGADSLRSTVMQQWPSITQVGGRRNDPLPEHPTGNAIDIMIPDYRSEQGIATGNEVLSFLQANADAYQVDGIIWRGQSYGYSGSLTSPRPYSMKGGDTAAHFDHLHVILGKGRGAGAAAVAAPSADQVSLPGGAGSSVSSLGGSTSAGGGSYRAATPRELSTSAGRVDSSRRAVTQAGQRVDDRTYARDRAQRRLDEARAAGKDTTDAQRSLDVANRELVDATEAQTRAKDKATRAEQDDTALREQGVQEASAAKSSEGSGNPFSDLGKAISSAFFETTGLDGSFLSNPFEWPTVKSVMAGVNVLGKALLGGGEGSATGPDGIGGATGAGGAGGDFLGAVADATLGGIGVDSGLASLNPGADIAAPASAVAPDTTRHGDARGAAPGPAVVIENAGMAPTDVANTLNATWNARTRTTKVR